MATWEGFKITIPAQPLLKGIESILETLLIFLEIVKSILEVIKIFLILFGNPLILLLEALMALILDLFHALQQTGIYAYYDLPDLAHDPNFKAIAGGSQAFKNRFNGSLLDQRDAHRPQPGGVLQGGFILLVIDADGPLILIQIIKAIIAFFKNPKRVLEPQYPAPVHLKATALNEAGSAIFDIETMLGQQSQSMAIEWQLPGLVPSASAGFAGLTATVIQNFRIPNWLIEIGESPPTQLITITPNPVTHLYPNNVMTDPLSTGLLKQYSPTGFTDPRNMGGNTLTTVIPVADDHGDPIVKFSYYAIIDGFAAFFAFLGGTVRYVWENMPLDKTYYVRVRAYFGNMALGNSAGPGGAYNTLAWTNTLTPNGSDGSNICFLPWPSTSSTPINMGKPSTMVKARLSKIPDFNVLGDIRALFQAAFSFNFHIPLPAALPVLGPTGLQQKDANGNPVYAPQFSSSGAPIPPLTEQDIGKGSLGSLAGAVSTFYPVPGPGGVEPNYPVPQSFFENQSPSGLPYTWPWQDPIVQAQSNKLAIKFSNILLEQGSVQIAAFKQLMRGPLPSGAVPGASSLEQLVLAMTTVSVPQTITPPGSLASVAAAFAAAGLNTTVDPTTANNYVTLFVSGVARENVMAGINFLISLGFQGVPPDWISMSILDLIPWSGAILYKIISVVQALIDAFKGLMQQLIDFINLIERKITALEIFIEYLISIINFLLNLNIGFYLLFVPSIDGDVSAWMQAVNSPLGTPPMSGPNGYTAGICLAYLLPDVSLIANAFGLIF
jgi:hypothetical protein